MPPTGEESDEQTRAYRKDRLLDEGPPPAECQKLMLQSPVEGRSSVEVRAIEGMPYCPYNRAKAAEACWAKIGERTIHGPGSSTSMYPTLSNRATYHSRGPPPEGVELPSLI
jgi:hypothetical protein